MSRSSRFQRLRPSAAAIRALTFSGIAAALFLSPSPVASSPGTRTAEGMAPVPAFAFVDCDGRTHSFNPAAPAGAPTLVFFFEPRSAAALMEMKFLIRLRPQLAEKGVEVVAVEASGLEDDELSVRRGRLFADATFHVAADPDYRLSRLFGVRQVPSTYLVAPDGRVLGLLEGFSRSGGGELTRMIVTCLREQDEQEVASTPTSILAAVIQSAQEFQEEKEPEMLAVGDSVAPFSTTDLEGKPVEAAWDAAGARVHVVFFWGAMCLPCMREMTYLEEIYRNAEERGLRILAVQATSMSAERTAAVMRRYTRVYPAPTFPIVADSDGSIRRTFGVKEGGPATFFIDRGGTVTFAIDDFALGYEDTMATKIERALMMGGETIALTRNADSERAAAPPPEMSGPLKEMFDENLTRGDFYYSTRKYDKALICYLKALSIEPADVRILCRVADIYERKGNLPAARREWRKVLDYDAGNAEARQHLENLSSGEGTTPPG